MTKAYRRGHYELFVVVAAIAIVATVMFDRYFFLAKDARNVAFEIVSQHFMLGAANARAQWMLAVANHVPLINRHLHTMTIANQEFYFSPQGWPASVNEPVNENYQPTINDCYQLWMALLQNPAPISRDGEGRLGSRQYHVSVIKNACRYQIVNDQSAPYYFDYFVMDGRVALTVPPLRSF